MTITVETNYFPENHPENAARRVAMKRFIRRNGGTVTLTDTPRLFVAEVEDSVVESFRKAFPESEIMQGGVTRFSDGKLIAVARIKTRIAHALRVKR